MFRLAKMNANFGTRFRCRGGCGEKLMVWTERGIIIRSDFLGGGTIRAESCIYLDVSFSWIGLWMLVYRGSWIRLRRSRKIKTRYFIIPSESIFLMDCKIKKKRKKEKKIQFSYSDENKTAIISRSIFRSRGRLSNPLTKISSFKGR